MTYNDEDKYIMTKKDYVRREKEWKKCVEWFRNAHDVAETIREQLPRIAHCENGHDDDDMQLDGNRIAQGIRNALAMLDFFPALVEAPADYDPSDQKDLYPNIAEGLMYIAQNVGAAENHVEL